VDDPPDALTAAVLVVRFGTEVALLGVLAVVGARLGGGTLTSWVWGAVLPAAAAVIWGAFIAPRASRRLPDPGRLLLEVVLFGSAAAALAATGSVVVALLFAGTAVGTAALVRVRAPGA
jgi:hypothetical protein